ncbi:MAG: ATP-dependent DNA helicase RecG [Deltaproteobacteria bacterium]
MDTQTILDKPIQYIKGVGEARAKLLYKLGIKTVEEMLYYFPRDYEDRVKIKKIIELYDEQPACFKASVISGITETRPRKGLAIQKLLVNDETGACVLTWFNQSYLKDTFKTGTQFMFFGKPSKKFGHLEIQSPVFEKIDEELRETGKIVPIYPLTLNLSQRIIRTIIKNALEVANNQLQEFLPEQIRKSYNLAEINYSINNIHFPKNADSFEYARRRLVFEELFLLQLGLLSMKNQLNTDIWGIQFKPVPELEEFIKELPFELTSAQKRVFKEINQDMEGLKPMNRLVQGDVGSGKTIVAVLAVYKAVKNGFQAAMMVPTGILAEQHYDTFKGLFEKIGIKTLLLTGSITQKQKREFKNDIAEGKVDVVIGTHALIEEDISFWNLGLVITDEQHRFGVRQRAVLTSKGKAPDVLVMTATPIPRTLALILYGDLDISVIDELPPGRKKIETYWIEDNLRARMNKFIEKQVTEGRQVYIVCPLVEESEAVKAKAVERHVQELQEIFKGYKTEFIHGKIKAREKDRIMHEFCAGKINILVSTTVIEVGVNVPNASLMVVENAEKFGLAQLHQLRGRVGRGESQSYCILMTESDSKIVRERMKVMQNTNDGFEISEKDLELRGPGEFFGTRQHGIPDLRIANLFKDIDMLKLAQESAKHILEEDKNLSRSEHILIKQKVMKKFSQRADEISFN